MLTNHSNNRHSCDSWAVQLTSSLYLDRQLVSLSVLCIVFEVFRLTPGFAIVCSYLLASAALVPRPPYRSHLKLQYTNSKSGYAAYCHHGVNSGKDSFQEIWVWRLLNGPIFKVIYGAGNQSCYLPALYS